LLATGLTACPRLVNCNGFLRANLVGAGHVPGPVPRTSQAVDNHTFDFNAHITENPFQCARLLQLRWPQSDLTATHRITQE
jgi:hypothetical protein